jgi:DNA gyrase subunit A
MGQAVRFHGRQARAMGRDTSGVAGMKLRRDDEVIEVDIAADDADLLVVTVNGYGKRTRVGDYPAKGRGTMGVKTAQLTEGKGRLVGARIVRDGYQVMLISDGGTVIRVPVDGIRRAGRATQGVIVMRLREGEQVATLAPVVGSDDEPETDEPEAEVEAGSEPETLAEGESAD